MRRGREKTSRPAPRVEQDRRFQKAAAVLIPIFVIAIFGCFESMALPETYRPIGFFGCAIVAIIPFGILWNLHPSSGAYRCPTCRTFLDPLEPRPAPGTTYRFYCPKCNVAWDTGLGEPDGDSGVPTSP